jgi:competence protein ComEA
MNAWLERQRGYLIMLLISLISVALITFAARRPAPGMVAILPPAPTQATADPTPARLTVYVSGAVMRPNVYVLPIDSRVADAVKAAGGLATDSLEGGINLAQRIVDGQQIHVPRQGEEPATPVVNTIRGQPVSAQSGDRTATSHLVNINTASASELEALPGIGAVLAGRIVAYRQTHGRFESAEQIVEVAGIGDVTFGKIQDLITTE